MEFKKYGSIENSYRNKFISRFDGRFEPDTKFVVMEKLHGANFQIVIEPDNKVTYCSRKRILEPDEKFFDYQNTIKKLDLYHAINFSDETNTTVQLFGELFGRGVNKGIDYGEGKQIRFFDLVVDGVIFLHRASNRGTYERALSIIKMRGVAHSRTKSAMSISSKNGIELVPLLKSGR